ncbi:alpha/beta hydrolase fold domain-containing protein [Paraburkholderia sp. GAS334]|uniref:alpha/beta hydrolase fold domain-containing protein n=1 Tax=Paraburkholderia sp. GAS334 TaxID=3035131 RepID=UPI003D193CF0
MQAPVVSVGYSRAPTFPLPAALHDGYLIALRVVTNARSLSARGRSDPRPQLRSPVRLLFSFHSGLTPSRMLR